MAQSESKRDTVFQNYKKTIVSITVTTGSQKTISRFNHSGNKTTEENYLNDTLHGSQRTWFPNGQISESKQYENGFIISREIWFSNGLPQQTEYFKIIRKKEEVKSVIHGLCRYYYSSGKLRESGVYYEGLKHGRWTEYYETGIKKSDGEYKNGYMIGKWTRWQNTGTVSSIGRFIPDTSSKRQFRVLRHGKQIQFFNTGKPSEISYYNKGKSNGRFTEWYENGQKKTEIDYCDNVQCGVHKTWQSNGDLKENYNFVSKYDSSRKSMTAFLDGKYEQYYENGKIKRIGIYRIGKANGLFIDYHQNGKESFRATYQNGLLSGKVVSSNMQGQIVRSESYIIYRTPLGQYLSYKHGIFMYYNDQGILLDSGLYDMDLKTGIWTSRHQNGNLESRKNYCANLICGNMTSWHPNGIIKMLKTMVPDSAIGFSGYTLYSYNEEGKLQGYSLMNDKDFTIESIYYFSNGIKREWRRNILLYDKATSTYSSSNKASRIITYHNNGNVMTDELQINDRNVGRKLSFYMNGRIKSINDYSERGIATGLSVQWDSEGGLISANTIDNHWDKHPFNGSSDSLYALYNVYFNDQSAFQTNSKSGIRDSLIASSYHKNAFRYTAAEQNGLLNGPCTMYYPDGKKLMETRLRNNVSDDTIRIWNPMGFLMSEKQTKNGLIRGRLREFYQTGILNSEVVYNDSGLVLSTQEMYANGLIKNINRYLARNRYSWIKHGKQESWHANGKPYNIYFCDSNKTIGAAYLYHPNGQLQELSYYKNGHRDSISSTFDSLGNIMYKNAYLKGVRHGKTESWWDNGQLKHSGWLNNEQYDSTWFFYNREGKQESIRNYKLGLLASAFSGRSCECLDSFKSRRTYAPLLNNLADLKTVNEWSFPFHKPFGEEYNNLFYVNLQSSNNQSALFYSFDIISYQTLELQIPEKNGIKLILNPCFSLSADRSPIRFRINIDRLDKSATMATLETKKLAIRFDEKLLHRWDSTLLGPPRRTEQNTLNTELLFNADHISYNSRDLISISDLNTTCFPHSEIGFTGTGIQIDSCEVDVNPEKNDFTLWNHPYSFEEFDPNIYQYDYQDYDKRARLGSRKQITIFDHFTGIFARKCRIFLPESVFKTASMLSLNGSNFMLGGTFVAGTLRLKATLSEGLNYNFTHLGRKITFNAAEIENKLRQMGYRNVKTSYDSKTSEFIIYLFYAI